MDVILTLHNLPFEEKNLLSLSLLLMISSLFLHYSFVSTIFGKLGFWQGCHQPLVSL